MKIFKKVLMIFLVISLLSNYLMILDDFGNTVYANLSEELILDMDSQDTEKEKVSNDYLEIESKIDDTSRYKGILLANLMLSKKKDFRYSNNLTINVKDYEKINSITITDDNKLVDNEGVEYDLVNDVNYKVITIDADEFTALMGKDGKVVVIDGLNDEIARIDENVDPVDGKYRLAFVDGIKNIRIQLSGMKSNGVLHVEFEKKFDSEYSYSREDIEKVDCIKISNLVETKINNELIEDLNNDDIDNTDNTDNIDETVENQVQDVEDLVNVPTTDEEVTEERIPTVDNKDIAEKAEDSSSITLEVEDNNSVENKETENKALDEEKEQNKVPNLDAITSMRDMIKAERNVLHTQELVLPMDNEVDEQDRIETLLIEKEIKLNDTETKADLKIDTETFSTTEENNVTFSIELKSNGEKYDIFKNPVFEIELPDAFENVEITNISLLYKNGLLLDSWKVIDGEAGKKLIQVRLSGVQTDYEVETIVDGTIIVIKTNVIINKLTTSKTGTIKLRYTNEVVSNLYYEKNGLDCQEYEFKYDTPKGLINLIEVGEPAKEKETAFNEKKLVYDIEANSAEKNVDVSVTLVNNYNSDLKNMTIIGKIPQQLDEQQNKEVGRLPQVCLTSGIISNGLVSKVYYSESENTEIKSDLWVEDVNELSKVKEFKIEIENDTVKQGETISYLYSLSIPENVPYNEIINADNEISFFINEGAVSEKLFVAFKTEEKEISIEDLEKVDTIQQDMDTLKTIIVEDKAEKSIDDLVEAAEAGELVESTSDIENIDEIKENDTLNSTQIVDIDDMAQSKEDNEEEETKSSDMPDVSEKAVEDVTTSEDVATRENTVVQNKYSVGTEVKTGNKILNDGEDIQERQILDYTVIIKNTSNEPIKQLKVKAKAHNANLFYYKIQRVLDEQNFVEVDAGRFDEDREGDHEFEVFEKDTLNPGEEVKYQYSAIVYGLERISEKDKVTYGEIEVEAKDIENASLKTIENNVIDGDIEARVFRKDLSNKDHQEIYTDDEFYVNGYVKNISSHDMENVWLDFVLPQGLQYDEKSTLVNDGITIIENEKSNGSVVSVLVDTLKSGEEANVMLITNTEYLSYDIKEKNCEVGLQVRYENKEYTANNFKVTITQNQTRFIENLTSNRDNSEEIYDGEEIQYTYTIKNDGVIKKQNTVRDFFGDALIVDDVYVQRQDGSMESIGLKYIGEEDDEKYFEYSMTLEAKEEATIVMNTHVSLKYLSDVTGVLNHRIESSYSDQEIIETNKLYIPENIEEISEMPLVYPDIEETEVEDITTEEEVYDSEYTDPQEHQELIEKNIFDTVETYSTMSTEDSNIKDYTSNEEVHMIPLNISKIKNETINNDCVIRGKVFEDVTNDGLYNDTDKGISNKTICLFDVEKNGIVARTYSNENGDYSFGVTRGNKYIIMFEYDSNMYTIVKDTNKNVGETNSSVVSTIVMEGKNYGITDEVSVIGTKEIQNMGLVRKEKAILDVSSYISEISVKGGNTYKFEKEDEIDNVEIHKANKNSDISAKLNVLIKNTGNLKGFFEQVKIKIPEGWTFDSEKNSSWSLDENGNAYYSGTQAQLIEPGGSEEVVLVIGKKLDKKANEVITQIDVDGSSLNDNEEVMKESTELRFKIKRENTIRTIVEGIFICSLVFVVLLILLNRYKEKIGLSNYLKCKLILYGLLIVSIISVLVLNIKTYVNGASGAINAEQYSTGYSSWVTYEDNSSYSNLNCSAYGNLGSLMDGARTSMLDSLQLYERYNDESHHTRTLQCMHGTSVTSGVNSGISLPSWEYRAAVIADFGYNNGSTSKIWRTSGSYKKKWGSGATNHHTDAGATQYLAYMGYYYNDGLYTVSGLDGAVTITNSWSRMMYRGDSSCVNTLEAGVGADLKFSGNPDDKSVLATGVLTELVKFYNDNKSRYGLNASQMGTDTVLAKKRVDEKIENASGDFYGPIKFWVPAGGEGGNIGNTVTMSYKEEGKSKVNIANIYTSPSDSSKQDVSYLISHNCSSSGIYVKLPDLGGKTHVYITSKYSYYEGRFLYLYQGSGASNQNKGIVRGRKTSTTKTIDYEIEPIRVDIGKTVHQICGDGSNTSYGENGCLVEYKVTLSCRGCGPAKNITFRDDAAGGLLEYVSIRTSDKYRRNDNGTFTYTGEIQKGKSANVYITYRLKADNYNDSNRQITNTVYIDQVEYKGKIVYRRNPSIFKISKNSVLSASASFKMRMYEAKINKWVEKVISADGTVKEYGGTRKSKTVSQRKSDPVYIEPGDQVVFGISLKNTGSGNAYGNIKTESIKEFYDDTYLEYDSEDSSASNDYTDPVDTHTSAEYGDGEGTVNEGRVERRDNADGTHKYVYIDEDNHVHDMQKIVYTVEQYTYWYYEEDGDVIAEYSEDTPNEGEGHDIAGVDTGDEPPVAGDRTTITDSNGRVFIKETVKVATGSGGNLNGGGDYTITTYILITDPYGNQFIEEDSGTNLKRYTSCDFVPAGDGFDSQIEIHRDTYYDSLEDIPNPEQEEPENPENPENPGDGTAKLPITYENAIEKHYANEEVFDGLGNELEAAPMSGDEGIIREVGASQDKTHAFAGQMPKGREYTYYYKYTAKIQNAPTGKIYCKADINSLTQHHSKVIYSDPNLIKSSSVTSSGDYIIIKGYKASIDKKIVKIESSVINEVDYNSESRDKSKILYGETGDYITFRIDISNIGTSPKYGKFVNPSFYDTFDGTELEYVGYKDVGASSYTVNGNSGNWSKSDYTFSYNGSIDVEGSEGIYIKFKVKKLSSTPIDIMNTATYGFINNKNSIRVFEEAHDGNSRINHLQSGSTITSSDKFRLRIYEAQVIKDIVSIDGVEAPSQENLTGELGDIVIYKITVKNTGKKDTHGKLHYIRLADLFETDQLEYKGIDTSYATDGWEEIEAKGSETIAFQNSSGIAVQTEKSFYIKMLVIYRSTVDDQWITNTASIRNINDQDDVLNRNKIEIVSVLNGTLTDDAKFRYLTYHIDFRKYMDTSLTVNGKTRMNLDNQEKYDNPIEHEKNDTDTYVLRLQDTGETRIHDIEIDDISEPGLTFVKGADGSYIKSAIINDASGGATNVKSQITMDITEDNRIKFKITPVLSPGDVIYIKLAIKIDKSNLYLWNLQNVADVIGVENKHHIQLILPDSDIVVRDRYDNKEFVRMKDLKVSGTVWKDLNRDGVMDDNEPRMKDIIVNLVDTTNNKKAVTKTDENGRYSFSETNGIDLSTGNASDTKMILPDGRAVKATNKDQTNGNYYHPGIHDPFKPESKRGWLSEYIPYYVEFEYNGGRYISTNNYAGDTNLNQNDFSMKEPYHKDSNAAEYQGMREEFENRLETVNYNNAVSSSGESNRLVYSKDGHVSEIAEDLSVNPVLRMLAYSFITDPTDLSIRKTSDIREVPVNDDSGDIKYLWLNRKNGDTDNYCYTGETDYLKEINLGLKVQAFDLTLEKDVYEVRTTVNGEEVIYDYNQGNNGAKNPTFIGAYATGGVETESDFTTVDYKHKFYASDYNYRATQYENSEVQAYKAGTELDVEITYMITIRNDKTNIDDDKENLYAVVNEITDYYPIEFIKYAPGNNTKTEKIFDRGADISGDTLVPRDRKIIEAFYYEDDAAKTGVVPLTISNSSEHKIMYGGVEARDPALGNQNKMFDGYNKLYITGLSNIVLNWNESKNIYIRYTLDKDATTKNLKISNGTSVSEINSYSTYESKSGGKGVDPAGYLDINSNPGNVGYNKSSNKFDNLFKYKEYENDTYRTGIQMEVSTTTPDGGPPEGPTYKELDEHERIIIGKVWDDARTKTTGTGKEMQYLGDGEFNSNKRISDARKNPKFDNKNTRSYDSSNSEFNSELEEKDCPIKDMRVKMIELITVGDNIYEETINTSSLSQLITTTNANGEFRLQGFIPGQYIVRYEYGRDSNDADVKASMVIFNGQDYKSTTFNPALDGVEITTTTNVNSKAGDTVLDKLVDSSSTKSDARDDAVRRLEVNGYSEYVTNAKSNVLQVSKLNKATRQRTLSKSKANENTLLEKTFMFADTPTFPVRIENDKYSQTVVHHGYYNHQELMYTITRYKLSGIDFGIEYRPETDIDISKFIKEIKVTTSSGKILYDLKFDIIYENGETSRITETKFNKNISVGTEGAQMIEADRKKSLKGFAFLNVDTETMQGMNIEIAYILNVNNISEVDRGSPSLRVLLKESSAPADMVDKEHTGYRPKLDDGTYGEEATLYRATYTARNILNAAFNKETRGNSKVRAKDVVRTSGGYYGKYLGNTYYTGNETGKYGEKDVIEQIRISEILDYIDNDMVFETEINNLDNGYWRATASDELSKRGWLDSSIFKQKSIANADGTLRLLLQVLDNKARTFDPEILGSRMALTVDEVGAGIGADNPAEIVRNKQLAKFLPPEIVDNSKSGASVSIIATKTIASDTDTDNMEFDNVAEVLEYRTENGRVTTVNSHSKKSSNGGVGTPVNVSGFTPNRSTWITVGNASLKDMKDGIWGDTDSKTDEPDTAICDMTVKIVPPTGKIGLAYYLRMYNNAFVIGQTVLLTLVSLGIIGFIYKKIKVRKKIYK